MEYAIYVGLGCKMQSEVHEMCHVSYHGEDCEMEISGEVMVNADVSDVEEEEFWTFHDFDVEERRSQSPEFQVDGLI
jgi:hypothetical protein